MCLLNGVAIWERCVSVARSQGRRGGRLVSWHGRRDGVAIWERWEGSKQRRWDGI